MTDLEEIKTELRKMRESLSAFTEPRLNVKRDSQKAEILVYVSDNPRVNADEIAGNVSQSSQGITRTCYTMWASYLLHRDKENGMYEYWISTTGEDVIDSFEEQQEITDMDRSGKETESHPWDDIELTKSQYHALKVVNEYIEEHEERPKPKDANDEYKKYGYYTEPDDQFAIGPRLTELTKKGMLDRPEFKPYEYSMSQLGKDVLEEAE